jgi:hypothetical protein
MTVRTFSFSPQRDLTLAADQLLTPNARNWLVRNHHEMPAMGMGAGEKAWFIGQYFHQGIEQKGAEIRKSLTPSGTSSSQLPAHDELELRVRVAAANLVQKEWREDMALKLQVQGKDEEDAVGKTKKLGDMAGSDACSRLFYNTLGMEMVMDCRPALYVFGEVLEKSVAIEMLQPSGGPLMAHFWLDVRVLINVRFLAVLWHSFPIERLHRKFDSLGVQRSEGGRTVAGRGLRRVAGGVDQRGVRSGSRPLL